MLVNFGEETDSLHQPSESDSSPAHGNSESEYSEGESLDEQKEEEAAEPQSQPIKQPKEKISNKKRSKDLPFYEDYHMVGSDVLSDKNYHSDSNGEEEERYNRDKTPPKKTKRGTRPERIINNDEDGDRSQREDSEIFQQFLKFLNASKSEKTQNQATPHRPKSFKVSQKASQAGRIKEATQTTNEGRRYSLIKNPGVRTGKNEKRNVARTKKSLETIGRQLQALQNRVGELAQLI